MTELMGVRTLQGKFFGMGVAQIRSILRTEQDRYSVTFIDGQVFNLVIDDISMAKMMGISKILLEDVEPFIEEDPITDKELDPILSYGDFDTQEEYQAYLEARNS